MLNKSENIKTNVKMPEINNLSDYLSHMVDLYPDKPAILYPKKTSNQELENEVNRITHGLQKIGIIQNTRTILLIPPGPEFIALTFALLRIGAILVVIDSGMGAKAMAEALANVKAEAFIGVSKAHLLRIFYPKAFKSIKICVTLGRRWFWRGFNFSELHTKITDYFPAVSVNPETTAGIFFTSGSTGQAKGVVYTVSMLNAQIQYLKSHFNYNSEEIELCTFPLLGLFSVCLGLSLVFPDMDTKRPATLDPEKVVANILDFGCTHMFCSPMVLNKLNSYCKKKKIKLLTLKRINTAGAPVSLELLHSFKQLLSEAAEIHTPYGATEALPITDISASELLKPQKDLPVGICVGRPLKGLQIKIIKITDESISSIKNTQELSIGEVGEIVVKGVVVSQEYYNNSNANKYSKIKDSEKGEVWHRMGDVGRLDKNGSLWFYGRKSHRVETSEGTLFSIPSEAVFNQHPKILSSALVGIPNGKDDYKTPVLCVQQEINQTKISRKKLVQKLLELGVENPLTKEIKTILFPKQFPVDARHNAKIQREKLAVWAEGKLK